MNKKTKLKLDIAGFISTVVLLITSTIPLYNSETDANLIGIIFGAFGAGVMLVKIIQAIKKR